MIKTPTMAVAAGELRPALAALGKVRMKGQAVAAEPRYLKVETVGRSSLRLTATDGEVFFSLTLSTTHPIEKTEIFLTAHEPLQRAIRGARANEGIPIQPVNGLPTSEFPESPVIRTKPIPLAPSVVRAFYHALGCSSKDPTRHVLQGVHFDPEGKGGVRVVATDGRHLYRSHVHRIPGLKGGFILPAHPVLSSPALGKEESWELRIAPKAKGAAPRFQLTGSHWSFTGELVQGNYPNYRQVIPPEEDFGTVITLPPVLGQELLRAIPRLPGKKLSNKPVGIQTNEGSVRVLAKSNDSKKCEELVLSKIETTGKTQTVFLNRDYLSQSLRCGMNRIEIIDEMAPVKCSGNSGVLIIMPVRSFGEVKVSHSRILGTPKTREKEVSRPESEQPSEDSSASEAESLRTKVSKTTKPTMKTPPPKENSTENTEKTIAEIRSALKAAASGLSELAASLRTSRQQQRQTDKEVRSVRQTLRRLRKVDL